MNVYDIITEQIIKQLELGTVAWRKPWKTLPATNLVSRKQYRGINAVLLNSLPFECPYFLTFKQARLLNGFVRHGEHGFPVVYWTFITDEETEKKIPLLRYYTVFNVAQCLGIEAPKTDSTQIDSIATCEAIASGMPNPPKVSYGGNQAFYVPKTDSITIPARERFESAEEFYSTFYHEMSHATGHRSRLDRKGISESGVAFGSDVYGFEELVAEISTSFLNAKAGIIGQTLENSAAYISNWLRVIRRDKRMVISAACAAQKAADYILGQPTNE